ncbi:MAG: polar amino acid transport system substrate-binding protein [Actinomycetota bacterium]|nr:polar amino acid transport system substrate-binding protein [Actinomycetota bacterium]
MSVTGRPPTATTARGLVAVLVTVLAGTTGCAAAGAGPRDVLGAMQGRQQVEEAAASVAAAKASRSAATASGKVASECSPSQEASFPPLSSLPAPGKAPAGTLAAKITARGYLVVGVSGDTRLLGARNARKSGQLEGFDIELAKALARAIFGTSDNRVRFKVITAGERFALVNKGADAGGVDIVARAVSMTCERWKSSNPVEGALFSAGYFTSDQRLLVRNDLGVKSIQDLKPGLDRVCAPIGSTSLAELAEHKFVKPVAAEIHSDCLALWQEGRVAAITGDDAILAGFADQDPRAVVVGTPMDTTYYAFAIGRGQEDFVQYVNAVMETPAFQSSWAAAYATYLKAGLGERSFPAPNYSRPLSR